MVTLRGVLVSIAAVFLLAGCSESKGKYVEIERGGFLFDYQLAQVKAGFTAKTLKSLPQGGILEASFENPAGGEALIVKLPVSGASEYDFLSPPITGVVKDKEYEVTLRVRNSRGDEVQRIEMAFASEMDGSTMPSSNSAAPRIPPPTVAFPPQTKTSDE